MNLNRIRGENLKRLSDSIPSPEKIRKQFAMDGDWFTAGRLSVPDGKILVGDPFAYLYCSDFSQRLTVNVESGIYPVQYAYIENELIGVNLCTLRLKLRQTDAVKYEIAHSAYEKDIDLPEKHFIGFPVQMGYITFISSEGGEKYREYIRNWRKSNPNKDFYDKIFAMLLEDFDDEDDEWNGDFTEWQIPGSELNMFISVSGLGNGFYIPYIGIDEKNEVCEIIVPVIDKEYIEEETEKSRDVWDGAEYCIATNRVAVNGCKVGYMYRDEISRSFSDSGWRFYEGNESGGYEETLNNSSIMSVHDIAENDPAIIPFLKSPYGTALYKNENGEFEDDELFINSW